MRRRSKLPQPKVVVLEPTNEFRCGHRNNEIRIREITSFDELFRALAGHRYEIVTLLALRGETRVSAIAAQLNLCTKIVSRDLGRLQDFGLVEWKPNGSDHIFRLTSRVSVRTLDGKVQFTVGMSNADWLTAHREEYSTSSIPVPPPNSFIDTRKKALPRVRAKLGRGESRKGARSGLNPDGGDPVRNGNGRRHGARSVADSRKGQSAR